MIYLNSISSIELVNVGSMLLFILSESFWGNLRGVLDWQLYSRWTIARVESWADGSTLLGLMFRCPSVIPGSPDFGFTFSFLLLPHEVR